MDAVLSDPVALAGLILALLLFGAATGFAAGLVGHGGGALLAPGLYALYGALGLAESGRMTAAVATALAIMAPLSVRALLRQRESGTLDLEAAARLAPFAAIGAGLAAAAALFAPDRLLILLCGGAALALGLQIAFWPMKGGRGVVLDGSAPLWAIGVGAASSLSGQGGGGFGAAALAHFGAPPHRAAATAAALGAAATAAGAAVFALAGAIFAKGAPPLSVGPVDLAALALAAPAWAMAAPLGAAIARLLEPMPIRFGYALLLCVIGVALMREAALGA